MRRHTLRLLTLAVTLAVGLAAPSAASAVGGSVRVETPDLTSFTPLLARTPVTLSGAPVTAPAAGGATQLCSPTSALAALDAAVGSAGWAATYDSVAGAVVVTRIRNRSAPVPPTGHPWTWMVYVDSHWVPDPCTAQVPDGTEVLFFPACTTDTTLQGTCFIRGPLYTRIGLGGLYDTTDLTVPLNGAPVEVHVVESSRPDSGGVTHIAPTLAAVVSTDEGASASSNDPHAEGIAQIGFTTPGHHTVRATENGAVPARTGVCATQGADGYCGTTVPPFNPFDPGRYASPCTTNGHDGYCGTTDTSGPVTHVTNITQHQVFKKRKGPGQIKGTIDVDPNGVKEVKLRLTRVVRTKVLVHRKPTKRSKRHGKKKPKPVYRYRTRCTAWSDVTALLESAHCGTKYAKWFNADLDDLRASFQYDFALTLPAGTYTLEVRAADENGFLDAPVAGRNLLTFKVS